MNPQGQIDVGIYATPWEYLEKAKKLLHPIDGELAVSDWTRRAIFEVLTTAPSALASHRAKFMKHVLQLRLNLEKEEVKLHATMEPHIQRVMRGKRILLFQALLQEYGYDDLGVIDELVQRLRLQDIDYVATMCVLAGRLSAKQLVSVTLSSGEVLTGKRAMASPSWRGRTLDLRKRTSKWPSLGVTAT